MAQSLSVYSESGNDTTGNGSVGTPYATLQKATLEVSPGGLVVGRGGTYDVACTDDHSVGFMSTVPGGVDVNNPTRFEAYQQEPVIWSSVTNGAGDAAGYFAQDIEYVQITGIEVDGNDLPNFHLFRLSRCHYWDFVNCHIHDGPILFLLQNNAAPNASELRECHHISIKGCDIHGAHPIASPTARTYFAYVSNCSQFLVENCNIYDISALVLQQFVVGPYGTFSDELTFRNNRVYDWGSLTGVSGSGTWTGLYLSQGAGHQIYNNLFHDTNAASGSAIQTSNGGSSQPATSNVSIYHNTLVNPGQYGLYLAYGSGLIAKNNIILGASTPIYNTVGATVSHNVTAYEGGDIATDIFVDPNNVVEGSKDFHLASGSGVIDGGYAQLSGIVQVGIAFDKDGVARPQNVVDAGAHEFISAAAGLWTAALQTPSGIWRDSSIVNHTCRFLMLASVWDTSVAAAFKLVFRGRTDAAYTIQKVSVVERDGATLNGVDATNKQVTFGGTWAAGGTVPQNGELISDTIVLALDEAKDYFVTFYASGSVGQYFDNTGGTTNAWFIAGDDATDIDWGAKSPTITWPHVYSVTRIEETTTPQHPDSAPSFDLAEFKIVTPGQLTQIETSVNDINDNIVLVTLLSTKVAILVDHTIATIDEYTG